MWRGSLFGAALVVHVAFVVAFVALAGVPAGAFMAYVSNEKSNTISVIDTDKLAVVKTIKVGQRPRGIELTKDGKFILVAAGDDDTIQMIDIKTHEVVGALPSGPDPELFTQDPTGKIVYVANENDNTVTIIDLERRIPLGEVQVGVEPEGMGLSPDGKILVNTSETTNMAHFIDTQTRQIVANVLVDARPRFAEFKPRRLRGLGFIRNRRNRERHRSIEVRGEKEDRLRYPRTAQGSHPAGRDQHHAGRQDRLRGARPRQSYCCDQRYVA